MVHHRDATFEPSPSRTLQIAMLVTAWMVSMISRAAVMWSQVVNRSKRFSLISLVLVLLIRVVSRLTTQLDCTDNQTGYLRYTISPEVALEPEGHEHHSTRSRPAIPTHHPP